MLQKFATFVRGETARVQAALLEAGWNPLMFKTDIFSASTLGVVANDNQPEDPAIRIFEQTASGGGSILRTSELADSGWRTPAGDLPRLSGLADVRFHWGEIAPADQLPRGVPPWNKDVLSQLDQRGLRFHSGPSDVELSDIAMGLLQRRMTWDAVVCTTHFWTKPVPDSTEQKLTSAVYAQIEFSRAGPLIRVHISAPWLRRALGEDVFLKNQTELGRKDYGRNRLAAVAAGWSLHALASHKAGISLEVRPKIVLAFEPLRFLREQ